MRRHRFMWMGMALAALAAFAAFPRSTQAGGFWEGVKGAVTGTYRCTLVEVEFSIENVSPDGAMWDAGNGRPDPYGSLTVMRDGRAITGGKESVGKRSDAFEFTASFFRRRGITIQRGDLVHIRLFDEDIGNDDAIGSVSILVTGATSSGSADNGAFSATLECK